MESKKRGKPVVHPKIEREDGTVFDTYTEAGDSIGGNRWGVMKCCYNIQRHHKGVKFRFVEKKEEEE